MKLENGEVPAKSNSSDEIRSRMKKVAPPPPPVSKPLVNGNLRHRQVGDESAIDESLEGRVDLEVVLPDLRKVRMTVDRRTPMMDLLVQATTSNKISPGGHIVNVISRNERTLYHQPNTPIGALDASTVYIVPKSTLDLPVKRMPKLPNQPFEQTFRLQVNLPHNQRMVVRISPRDTLDQLKRQICSEKELDSDTHHLVHPSQQDTALDLDATLEVYGCAEINLMSSSDLRDSIRNNYSNLYPYPKPKIEEEKKKKGILRLFSRKKKDFSVESTNGGLTSSQSLTALNRASYQPKQSLKRKPAPAPPSSSRGCSPPLTQSLNSINSEISHSRHSSDSSGYHEPSVFSDCSENKSPEASSIGIDHDLKRASMSTNLRDAPSGSSASIVSAARKRKAPQPPPQGLAERPDLSTPSPINDDSASSTQTDVEYFRQASGASTQTDDDDGDFRRDSLQQREFADIHDSRQEREFADVHDSREQQESADIRDSRQQREFVDSRRASKDSIQESEAIQYLENVLQESEQKNFANSRTMDDSDTDSMKDEGEIVSVCQAEIHVNATSDQDSSDSVVEPQTVVTPEPKHSPHQDAYPEPNEAVDPLADDSGISQSLNSDADSSVPSLNSDLKTLSDSGCCQEEIYCNVTDSFDAKSVPSSEDFPIHECSENANSLEHATNYSELDSLKMKLGDNNTTVEESAPTNDSPTAINDRTQNMVPTEHYSSSSVMPSKEVDAFPTESESPVVSPEDENPNPICDNINSDKLSITSSVSTESARYSAGQTPPTLRKLDNFALGCYKQDKEIDIYSMPSPEHRLSSVDDDNFKKPIEPPLRKRKNQPAIQIMSLKDRDVVDISPTTGRKLIEKPSQLSSQSFSMAGRSSSLFNLNPLKKFQRSATDEEEKLSEEVVNGGMKRTCSDQNVAIDLQAIEAKENFLLEQKRLQQEYLRLQEQFISWQRQLMCNQSLLQSEKIMPPFPFPSLESFGSLDSGMTNESIEDVPMNVDLKTMSLPRPKSKPFSVKEHSNKPSTPPISPVEEVSVAESDDDVQKSNSAAEPESLREMEPVKRPDTLRSCSVDVQADLLNQENKVTQVPSPQDKVTQVPSPQEKVTSGTQVPSPETVAIKDTSAQTSDISSASSPESEANKSQTLPRPKPKPISALPPERTMTLNRNTRSKSQAVSVTIGSWQQRQTDVTDIEPMNVASMRSKFMSLENIPQSSNKVAPIPMEKRKLPPVPIENSAEAQKQKVIEPKVEYAVAQKSEGAKPKTKPQLAETKQQQQQHIEKKPIKSMATVDVTKGQKTHAKQIEEVETAPKQIKAVAKEPTGTFKLAKPFVKLTSMKDESHTPSIIGLRKWPLSDISESLVTSDQKQVMLDDLKASSKKPGGFVQEKIRRAEVDLRKPKSSKTIPKSIDETIPKSVDTNITNPKSFVSNTIPKTVDTTDATIPKSVVNDGATIPKTIDDASKIHITKVSIKSRDPQTSSYTRHSIPKSQSLNNELLSVFSKKAESQKVTVNGSQPPPPPPPPSSAGMPVIPPAEQIPVSSQLLMAGSSKTLPASGRRESSSKKSANASRMADPREELMLEIRGFGGKKALKKAPSAQPGWRLKVYGSASTVNS